MSIIKRKDRWGVKVSVGGKQVWVGTYPTRREARQAESKFLAKHKPTDGERETCAEFVERWLAEFPRPRASTNKRYKDATVDFVKEFGTRPLDTITRKEARGWAIRHQSKRSIVRTMYGDAMNEGIVDSNPFANLRLPLSRGRKDIKALTVSQIDELAAAAHKTHGAFGGQYAAMIKFAAYTGIRRGELSVIEWSDINFETGEIVVSKTLSNDTEILPPKNDKPRRIVLPPQAREALKAVPRRLDTKRIFNTPNGKMFTKSTFHYHWNPVRCLFGQTTLAWHELRHFTATYLVQELRLPPRQAAQQLGHSDAGKLILSLYAHPDEDRMRDDIREAFKRNAA